MERIATNDVIIGILYATTGAMIFLTALYWGKIFDKALEKKQKIQYFIATLLFFLAALHVLYAFVASF